jgi:hypothetical protein
MCDNYSGGHGVCNSSNIIIDLGKRKKWAANQSILRGVKALAIELVLESKENQMITVSDL